MHKFEEARIVPARRVDEAKLQAHILEKHAKSQVARRVVCFDSRFRSRPRAKRMGIWDNYWATAASFGVSGLNLHRPVIQRSMFPGIVKQDSVQSSPN